MVESEIAPGRKKSKKEKKGLAKTNLNTIRPTCTAMKLLEFLIYFRLTTTNRCAGLTGGITPALSIAVDGGLVLCSKERPNDCRGANTTQRRGGKRRAGRGLGCRRWMFLRGPFAKKRKFGWP